MHDPQHLAASVEEGFNDLECSVENKQTAVQIPLIFTSLATVNP